MRVSRIYAVIAVISIVGAIVFPIVGSIAVRRMPSDDELLGTVWITMAFGLAGFISALAMERSKARAWMISGLVVGALAWAGWEYGLWFPRVILEPFSILRWLCIAGTGWAMLMSFTGLLLQLGVPPGVAVYVRRFTIGVAACLAVFAVLMATFFTTMADTMTWRDRDAFLEMVGRGGGVLGVLTLGGTLGVLASVLVPRIGLGSVPESLRRDLAITCPRCGREQTIRSHGDACAGCGLRIKVTPQ
ncbi:MAG: hypothetical protein GY715_01215 [Planctomycetes bacterium]|nr:hypothetical protein [Planctomycetota bacterium]